MRFNGITVMPVRSLEVGDTFAFESIGRVIGGKITGKAYTRHDLTNEQLVYMKEHDLKIPDSPFEGIGGLSAFLLFGEFTNHPNHIFLDFDVNVAVFSTAKKDDES